MSYRIVCDSCTDLNPSMLQDPHFVKVPLTIRVGDVSMVDDATLVQSELLWRMKECPDAPQTACPSPSQYLEVFEEAVDDIYVVTLSALLSGSHNVATQAKAIYEEEGGQKNVYVFNSCSASAGQVRIALKIQELAEAGHPFAQVVAEVNRFIAEMKTLFVLESLDNLRKNGRLSKVQAIVTGTLKIKLLMGSTPEGQICKLGQGMSIKQTLNKMVGLVAADEGHKGKTLVISHCNCLDRAFYVRELLEKSCQLKDIVFCETGGISTVYANDGGIVLAY